MAGPKVQDSELTAPEAPLKRNNRRRKRCRPKKKQQSRPRSNSDSDASVDTCATATLSDDNSSTSGSPRRNGQRGAKKTNNKMTAAQKAQYLALDAEMVGVGPNGTWSALARVTLIDWDGNVVLDEYVRPEQTVTDYRTFVSGIHSEDLESSNVYSLEQIRKLVLQHLEGKILVGHALKNDLHALGIRHPWQQTRDTAKYEPFMKVRFDDGILWPRKLRDLMHEVCLKDIQTPGLAHSPYEDALAALDLYKKVRCKWEKVMDYKIKKTASIQHQQQQQQPMPQAA